MLRGLQEADLGQLHHMTDTSICRHPVKVMKIIEHSSHKYQTHGQHLESLAAVEGCSTECLCNKAEVVACLHLASPQKKPKQAIWQTG